MERGRSQDTGETAIRLKEVCAKFYHVMGEVHIFENLGRRQQDCDSANSLACNIF